MMAAVTANVERLNDGRSVVALAGGDLDAQARETFVAKERRITAYSEAIGKVEQPPPASR